MSFDYSKVSPEWIPGDYFNRGLYEILKKRDERAQAESEIAEADEWYAAEVARMKERAPA